jgi:hypothetical protein
MACEIIVDVYLGSEAALPIHASYTWRGKTEAEAMTAYRAQLASDATLRDYVKGEHDGASYVAKLSVYRRPELLPATK